MTKIITVTNQKGGVGKTTTASALVSGLHERGARVLGIDLDPQGNLGFTLGLDIGQVNTVYDVLKGTVPIENAIYRTEYGDIIPSDIMLSTAPMEFNGPRCEFMLEQHLRAVRANYDFIIIDTPPALNLLTINAYVASTGLIIPMEPEILSLVGVSQLRDTYETVQKSCNPHLQVLGILMNQYNNRLILHRDVLEMAEEVAQQMGSQVFPAKIRRSVDVAAAPAHGQSVVTYSPKSNPARDFRKVIDCIVGDAYPRPRYHVPASLLELQDALIQADGSYTTSLKYMFDYTASAGYETCYLDMHLDNKKLYEFCEDAAAGKTNTGIRVWQEKHTFADADLSDIPDQRQYIDGPMMYSQAAWALAAHGIPSVHQGSGCAAIVFGESARTLPEEFKKRPLILDIQAARILAERNWQLGLTGSGERIQPGSESFKDGEIVQILNRWPGSRKITVDKNAEIWSEFSNMDTPASYKYFAPDGGKYLVLNFEATISHESSYRNYRFSESIRRFLSDCQVKLPAVVVSKNPDIYMQCKDDAAGRAIGIWNCSADYSKNVVIELDGEFKNAEFAGIKGSLQGNKIIIELIEAFRFGFIKLSR